MNGPAILAHGSDEAKAWLKAHLDYPHDWCLMWPFATDGSGYPVLGGQHVGVHRLMCEHRNGPAPSAKHQAAHSCGRGHRACVNPRHLTWKTASENQLERYQQSGPGPRWKLTPAQVDEIRALEGRALVADIAAQYNITRKNVRDILAGRLWKQDRTGYREWTSEEIQRIRTSPVGVVGTVKALAEEFGVASATIYRIKNGQSYSHVQSEAKP